MNAKISVSIGELVDKITILQIKKKEIKDKKKLIKIEYELNLLENILSELLPKKSKEFTNLFNKLRETNNKLWEIEDDIRKLENKKDFSDEFIKLARSVYITNDYRFEIKNKINLTLSSEIQEVKSYEKY